MQTIEITVKIGTPVTVHLNECSDYDQATMLLNNHVYEFPESGNISIGDYLLVKTPNKVVVRIHNLGGGPLGEPSKWSGRFSVYADGKTYGPIGDQGDDWFDKRVHVIGTVIIHANDT